MISLLVVHLNNQAIKQLLYYPDLLQFQYAPMPPPPAPVNNSDLSHDNDALASMLMAWYLSGYHTGYYQVRDLAKVLTGKQGKEREASMLLVTV